MIRYLTLLSSLLCGQTLAQTLPEAVTRGKAVYDANCSTCHGAAGTGGNGVPALSGSPTVMYDTARQLRTILDGTPRGMSSWAKLTDGQIADVITFTKNQWSNATGVIMSPLTVSAARLRGDGCVDQLFSPLPQPADTVRVSQVTSPAGKANVWWCLLPARQGDVANRQYWRMQIYPVHNDDANKLVLVAAAGRIVVASDPIAQAWSEVNAARIALVPGSQKDYEYKQLAWLGCERLRVTPLPNGTVLDPPLAADHCGVMPIPSTVAPALYYIVAPFPGATRRATYPFVGGVRSTLANGSIAILNGTLPTPVTQPRVTEGTTTYCGLIGLPTSIVACRPR